MKWRLAGGLLEAGWRFAKGLLTAYRPEITGSSIPGGAERQG